MLESDVKQLYYDWLVKDFGSMKKIEVWPIDIILYSLVAQAPSKLRNASTPPYHVYALWHSSRI